MVFIDFFGDLWGCNVYVGGGMGCIYNKEEIFVCMVDFLGYVDVVDVLDVV